MYDPGQLYVDPILTNFSVGYRDPSLYGEQIMPVTPVNTPSGRYRVFGRFHWLIYESRREPGAVANEIVGARWSEDNFETQEHSLQAPIFDEERQQLSSQGGLASSVFGGAMQLDPEVDATAQVTRSLLLEHELKVSTLVRDPANYPNTNVSDLSGGGGAGQFDNYTGGVASTSNPVAAIQIGMRTIYGLTGRYPNVLAVPSLGMTYIENHPRIVDRFKTFTLTDTEAFRKLTGFNGTILPVDSMYNAANNIDAEEDIQFFWGKDIWLGVVDKTPAQKTFSFGKTFAQTYPNGSTRPTDRWREEPRKADLVRTSYKYDLKIVASSAGYLISNAFSNSAF